MQGFWPIHGGRETKERYIARNVAVDEAARNNGRDSFQRFPHPIVFLVHLNERKDSLITDHISEFGRIAAVTSRNLSVR